MGIALPFTFRRKLSQLEKYNFSGERNNHWTGRCKRIKRTTLSPLAASLENRRMTLFHLVDMVSGIPHAGLIQNERFFEL
jgi:hypothetical protein